MIKNSDKKHYRIQVVVNGNPLTYNYCTIIDSTDSVFLTFSDKFNTIFKINKSAITIMEELKE